MNDLLSKILCIECGGKLRYTVKSMTCAKCGKKYVFENGVLIMLSSHSLKDKQNASQKRFYDDHYQSDEANKDVEWKKRWVKRLLGFLPKSKKSYILDVACGQAYMTIAIAQEGYKVIACDISISGLMHARKEAAKLHINKNILFIACDINTVRFKKNTFDFIILLHILEHLVHDKLIMKKIISSAKKKALYYIGVPLSLVYVFPLMIPLYLYSDKKVGHQRRYTVESILNLFTFKAEAVYSIYTGHLIKFASVILLKIGIHGLEKYIEDLDEKMLSTKLWASNITAVIRRRK